MSTTTDLDAKELNSIAASLNLDYDTVAVGWWLPADPGPILCASVADGVREAMRLVDNDAKRLTARLTVLADALAFYADAANWKSSSTEPSLVEKDAGSLARAALEGQ